MTDTADGTLRRLRLGMVGGGQGGNIGRSHRAAALLDGRWDVVAGALSRDPAVAAASAARWLIAPERVYPNYRAMAEGEAGRADRIDAVTICTRNDTHHPIARAFLDRGFHVVCDKPLTTSLENARDLVRATRAAGRWFFVTYTYSGYPMVRLARDMISRWRTWRGPLDSGRVCQPISDRARRSCRLAKRPHFVRAARRGGRHRHPRLPHGGVRHGASGRGAVSRPSHVGARPPARRPRDDAPALCKWGAGLSMEHHDRAR